MGHVIALFVMFGVGFLLGVPCGCIAWSVATQRVIRLRNEGLARQRLRGVL